jgi:regulatory protein YycH of two-component signal transduction system YycFG
MSLINKKNNSEHRMKNGIISILENIKTYVGYYLAVVSVVGVMWGGFTFYNNWKEGNKAVKTIVKTDSLILKNQTDMTSKLNAIEMATKDNTEELKSLSSSYIQYISNDKSLTKTDFLNYMRGLSFDVKKNLLNYNESPTQGNLLLVQQK